MGGIQLAIRVELTDEMIADLWDAVWTSVEYGACSYWMEDVQWERDEETKAWTSFTVTDEDGNEYKIGPARIGWAFKDLVEGRIELGYPKRYLRSFLFDKDAGHIDVDAVDALVQAACFKQLVYG